MDQHISCVKEVMERISEYSLKLIKCFLAQEYIKLLSRVVGRRGIKVGPEKLRRSNWHQELLQTGKFEAHWSSFEVTQFD